MTSENWHVFREIYFKIILSILVVIAAMLILQNSLNHLKLRALVAEATSSRLQITAATIESAVVKAEALGLAMDEMNGLQDLLDRERTRDTGIEQIMLVSPIGVPIVSSGAADLPAEDKELVLRRILGSGDKVTLYDSGPRLYTARILKDSSDAVMGAVILTTPSVTYLSRARAAFSQMTNSYVLIFGVVALLLVPFIIYQFSGVRHAFREFDANREGVSTIDENEPDDIVALRRMKADSRVAYASIKAEVEDTLAEQGTGKRSVSFGEESA